MVAVRKTKIVLQSQVTRVYGGNSRKRKVPGRDDRSGRLLSVSKARAIRQERKKKGVVVVVGKKKEEES